MAKKYITWAVERQLNVFFEDCEFIYRKHHPELKDLVLTKTKILKEVFRFYLKGTERKILDD